MSVRRSVATVLNRRAEVGAEEGHGDDDDDRDEGDHEAVLDGGRALLRAELLELDECLGHDGGAFRSEWERACRAGATLPVRAAPGAMARWGRSSPPNGRTASTVRPIAAARWLRRARCVRCFGPVDAGQGRSHGRGGARTRAGPGQAPFRTVTLWLLTLGGGLLAALLIRLRQGVDPDLWLHLRIGEQLRAGERFQRLPGPPRGARRPALLPHPVAGRGGHERGARRQRRWPASTCCGRSAIVTLLALLQLTAAVVHHPGAGRGGRPAGPRGHRRPVGRAAAAGRPRAARGDDLAVVASAPRRHGALARRSR